MVSRPAVIAVLCVGFFLILQGLIPKSMAMRNPSIIDRFMTDGHKTHKRKNYMVQRALDKDFMGNIENSVAYDVEPFNPDSDPEELSAFMVDYANMIRNDVILLDKSVETRTRKRGNTNFGKYKNQVISRPDCICKPNVTNEILGEDSFPQRIEIRYCVDGYSCSKPYACNNTLYNITILHKRKLNQGEDGNLHSNLRPNWIVQEREISVGCTCISDYVLKYKN